MDRQFGSARCATDGPTRKRKSECGMWLERGEHDRIRTAAGWSAVRVMALLNQAFYRHTDLVSMTSRSVSRDQVSYSNADLVSSRPALLPVITL
ncbi:hypothetical protein HPB50_018447 [Hyalomma asiaticum]|uniref:Uncharacterized protein n=1 Tax=Hyalomma asiaticum TaxID=266040 RepID=A0ACB7S1T0_HYAAI|nr:hypothetical protein HPB50_018447 [Hyalomma asiaticum]